MQVITINYLLIQLNGIKYNNYRATNYCMQSNAWRCLRRFGASVGQIEHLRSTVCSLQRHVHEREAITDWMIETVNLSRVRLYSRKFQPIYKCFMNIRWWSSCHGAMWIISLQLEKFRTILYYEVIFVLLCKTERNFFQYIGFFSYIQNILYWVLYDVIYW